MVETPKNTNGEKDQEEPKEETFHEFLKNPAFALVYLEKKGENNISRQLKDGKIKSEDLERVREHYEVFKRETQDARDAITPELIDKITKYSPDLKNSLDQSDDSGKSQADQITQQLEILYSTEPERYAQIIHNLEIATKYDRKATNEQIEDFADKHNIPTKELKKSLESDEKISDKAIARIVKKKAGLLKRMGWRVGKTLDISSVRMNMGIKESEFEDEIDELRNDVNQDIKELGELLYTSLYVIESEDETAAEAFADNLPANEEPDEVVADAEEAEVVAEEAGQEESPNDEDNIENRMYSSITEEMSDLQKKYDEEKGKPKKKRKSTPSPIPEEKVYEPTDEELLDDEVTEKKDPPPAPKEATKEERQKDPKEEKEENRHKRKGKFELKKNHKGNDQWTFERTEKGVTIRYLVDLNEDQQPNSSELEYNFIPAQLEHGEPKPILNKNDLSVFIVKLQPPFPEEKPTEDDELDKIANEFMDSENEGEEAPPEAKEPAPTEQKEAEVETEKVIDPKEELKQINEILTSSSLDKAKNEILQLIKEGEFDNAIKILDEDENEGKFDEKIFEHIENLSGENYESQLKKFWDEISRPSKDKEAAEPAKKTESDEEKKGAEEIFDEVLDLLSVSRRLFSEENGDAIADAMGQERYEQAINLLKTEYYSQEGDNQDKIKEIINKIIDLDPERLEKLRKEFT